MPLTRSENMSRIKSSNTKPEIRLRKALWAEGLRYRLQYKINNIRPDIVFVAAKVAVFVDGCQWHGCPQHYVKPRTRNDFWGKKLRDSVERDISQTKNLEQKGWVVYRVWEHEVWEDLDKIVHTVMSLLHHNYETDKSDWRVIKVDIIDLENDVEKRHLIRLTSVDKKTIVRKRSTKKWKRK